MADDQDPELLGRIRAIVPEVLADVSTGWALPCLPYTGPGVGFHAVPPVGAGVWVEFEAGDPSRPIWTGGWWGSGQVPTEETGKPTSPSVKVLRTDQGLLIALDDDDQTIAISDSGGTNIVELIMTRGEIRVQAASKVIVEAPLIDLIENAAHPVAFGDSLLQYLGQLVTTFNTHVHVGQMAAGVLPVTPAPPPTPQPPPDPSLLSTRVKSG